MELKQLRSLVAVARLGNLTRAAEELGITQPALGMQLRALEESLGVSLIERHSRGVRLTGPGRYLTGRADEILHLSDRTRREIADMAEEPYGTIRVGMSPTASLLFAKDLVTEVSRQTPRVSLELVENSSAVTLEWLLLDRIDVAFVFGSVRQESLETETILRERLCYIAASGGTARHDPIRFEEAAATPMILPGKSDFVRQTIDRLAAAAGVRTNVLFEMQSVYTVADFVASGHASTILPGALVQLLSISRELDIRPVIEPDLFRNLSVAHARGRTLSKAEVQLVTIGRKLARQTCQLNIGRWYELP